MSEQLYRVAWRNKTTGLEDHQNRGVPHGIAKYRASEGNKSKTSLYYWVERIDRCESPFGPDTVDEV